MLKLLLAAAILLWYVPSAGAQTRGGCTGPDCICVDGAPGPAGPPGSIETPEVVVRAIISTGISAVTATCPAGKIAISGGCDATAPAGECPVGDRQIYSSRPDNYTTPTGWFCGVRCDDVTLDIVAEASVLCVTAP